MKKNQIKILIILAVFLIAGALLGPEYYQLPDGVLVDAFALPSGGSVVLVYSEIRSSAFLDAVYRSSDYTQTQRAALQYNGAPDRVLIEICGDKVHAYVNWTEGYDPAVAPVQEIVWTLPERVPNCRSSGVWLPMIAR